MIFANQWRWTLSQRSGTFRAFGNSSLLKVVAQTLRSTCRTGRSTALLLVGLLLAAQPEALNAAAAVNVGIAPGYPGSTVSVPVRVGKATNVVGAQFDISYDRAKVSAGTPSRGPQFASHLVRSREVAPGVIRVVAYSLNNTSFNPSNVIVATVPFTLSATERTSSGPLVPSNAMLAKRDGTALTPVALNAGNLFVNPVFLNPDGTVNFFLPAQPDERYVIQATTDFVSWVNLSTTIAPGNFMDLIDLDAPNYPRRFYRSALFDALGQVSSISRSADGSVILQVVGLDGRTYVLQASSDLKQWVDIDSKVATGAVVQFTDATAGNFHQRFYRLRSSP